MARSVILKDIVPALIIVGMVGFCITSSSQADTAVRFDTALGTVDVQLYDSIAPITVNNFLNYVNGEDYNNSFFHRLSPGFCLQGGGFAYYPDANGVDTFWTVPKGPTIQNEFQISNTRGTIAMAKVAPDDPNFPYADPDKGPDSATNQFFFNLDDNSSNLNNQNGGFTVFGEVLGSGMDVVDLLASQTVWSEPNDVSVCSYFPDLPLIDYSTDQTLSQDHLEMVNSIVVISMPGDASLDEMVGATDLALLAANWGLAGDWFVGDFSGDRFIGMADLVLLKSNWGNSNKTGQTGGAIPEPATASLLIIGALFLKRRRRGHQPLSRGQG